MNVNAKALVANACVVPPDDVVLTETTTGTVQQTLAQLSSSSTFEAPWVVYQMAAGVNSCDELAFEHYWDYAAWEYATTISRDPRQLFEDGAKAFEDGIESKSGATVHPAPPVTTSPKNVYFTLETPYPWGETPYAFAALGFDLGARLAAGRDLYTRNLAWHQATSQTLAGAGFTDADLVAMRERQVDFARLMEARAAMWARWQTYLSRLNASRLACEPISTPFLNPFEVWFDPVISNVAFVADVTHVRPQGLWAPLGSDLAAQVGNGTAGYVPPGHGLQWSPTAPPHPFPMSHPGPFGRSVWLPHVRDMLGPQVQFHARPWPDSLDVSASGGADPGGAGSAFSDTATGGDLYGVGGNPEGAGAFADTAAVGHHGGGGGGDVALIWNNGIFDIYGLPVDGPVGCEHFEKLLAAWDVVADAVANALRVHDAPIEAALVAINQAPYRCLEIADDGQGNPIPSPCDWTPQMFVDQFRGHYGKERERLRRRCDVFTANDFSATAMVRNAKKRNVATDKTVNAGAVVDDFTTSSEEVIRFFDVFTRWVDSQVGDEIEIGPDGYALPGRQSSARKTDGDQQFGADWGYEASWRIDGLVQSDTTDGFKKAGDRCAPGLSVRGRAFADATVFGAKVSLLSLEGRMQTGPHATDPKKQHAEGDVDVRVLGIDLLGSAGDPKSGDLTTKWTLFHFSKSEERDQVVASATFTIGPFPVTIRAGLAGRAGIAVDLAAELKATCDDGPGMAAEINGAVTPVASVSAYATVGLDLGLVEAGLRVDIVILQIELPFDAAVRLVLDQSAVRLEADAKLELELSTLDGKLSAFVRILFFTFHATLFDWQGVTLARETLFSTDVSAELVSFQSLLRVPLSGEIRERNGI
jgi:hypothetical protein